MNILQVIPFFSLKYGGGVEVCVQLSGRLRDLGHSVTIITSDHEFDPELARNCYGIEIIPFRTSFHPASFVITPALLRWVTRNIRRFDLVHLHDFRSFQNIIVSRVAQKDKIPYILSPHGSIPVVHAHTWKKTVFDVLFKKRIIGNAAFIIANSQSEFRHLQNTRVMLPEVKVVYNGISPPRIITNQERVIFRQKYSIPSEYFLFMGRIDRTKGLDFLIQGYHTLLSKMGNHIPDLVIAGPRGNASDKLERDIGSLNIRNRVRILPFMEGTDKEALFSDCIAFFSVPAYDSGVLLAPAEALLHKKPVIVTRECSELFESGKGSFILEYGDIQNFVEFASYIINHPDEVAAQVEEGEQSLRSKYSWETMTRQCEEIYLQVIDSHH